MKSVYHLYIWCTHLSISDLTTTATNQYMMPSNCYYATTLTFENDFDTIATVAKQPPKH